MGDFFSIFVKLSGNCGHLALISLCFNISNFGWYDKLQIDLINFINWKNNGVLVSAICRDRVEVRVAG